MAPHSPRRIAGSELPQPRDAHRERRDAARNRQALLAAAHRLLREQGAESITMERLASEAGVGKGTLFRRFGDRAGLFYALLDETERRFQDALLQGAPPLGPGAPPVERLIAFGEELIALTEERGDLLLAAQPPEATRLYESAVHGVYRTHVRALLAELGTPDVHYRADVLLAVLHPALVIHQLRRGASAAQLSLSWQALVRRISA